MVKPLVIEKPVIQSQNFEVHSDPAILPHKVISKVVLSGLLLSL